MYKHVAETFVPVSHAARVAETLCARYREYCRSIRAGDTDTRLDFGDACAILRATTEGLYFRVEARDITTFYGIQTLFQGSLPAIMALSGESVEWRTAGACGPQGN